MKKSKYLRLFCIIATVLVLLPVLSACESGKKFDSPESMISEMTGTYSGTNEHSDERIVISENSIIKFNIADIFPQITDGNVFWENFPNENWEELDLSALLGKPYITITTEPISADVKKSTLSGLWVNKDSVLFSSTDGYPLNKISPDSIYPTTEMQEKFEEYRKHLQEYETSIIIAEAQNDYSEKEESLQSAASSADSKSSSLKESSASAETIAECAFESVKDHFKYPRTATLEGYSRSPQRDPFGRVCTLITVTSQNIYGNYITEDCYVVLQSCSYSGYYTYKTGGMHYTKNGDYLSILLTLNDWNENPNAEDAKENRYKEAIHSIKQKKYQAALNELIILGDYKSSAELKQACVNFTVAERYKKAIDLFAKEKYTEARKELASLLDGYGDDYLRAKRVITLCDAAINNTSSNENITQPPATQPPTTQPPATQPPATQPPATCSHNYTAATCTKPQTCTLCGETVGSVLGHTFSDATCTAPITCTECGETVGLAAGHRWKNITQTVQHEERGHYEDVQKAKDVQKIQCYACSHKTDTLDEYYSHFDNVHGNSAHYLLVRERYEMVYDRIYETVTEWVVDQEAYTETLVIGRTCDVCGKTEQQ